MGKGKQHSKDRMFLTATEWKELGGKKADSTNRAYRPLPFDSCALSLQPYETPVCTPEGVLFDILNLFPYVQKHKKSPITGEPMTAKDIVRLNMHKNAEGKWHCPVTFKEFTDHSKVVAVKPSGQVYAWDAVEELNIKRKNWTDLMTGEAFTRKDIITLQDPSNAAHMALRDISNFKHLEEMRAAEAAKQAAASAEDRVGATIRTNASTEVVIREFQRQKREREEQEALKAAAAEAKAVEEAAAAGPDGKRARVRVGHRKILVEDLHPGKKVTTGAAAASFTATGMDLRTGNQCREATEEEVREVRWRFARKLGKKGYVQLQTSLGNLNVEVHCDFVPRTAENFLGLCLRGFYDGLAFHRCIKDFMIQGGCPKGDGTGGDSIYGGKPFKDEFDSRLIHDRRGVLSMANSGRDTNRSQFFITFKGCRHLDNQHTVFGRVVGGMETLARMEAAEVDKDDRPVKPIKLLKAVAFVNPFDESDAQFEAFLAARQAEREADERFRKDNNALGFSRPAAAKRSEAEAAEAARTSGFYSQPGPAAQPAGKGKEAAASGGSSGGVGKYLGGGGGVTTLPRLPAGGVGVGPAPHPKESPSLQQQAVEGKKKAAPGAAMGAKPQFKNFDNW